MNKKDYINAMEQLNISEDFNERTAKLMKNTLNSKPQTQNLNIRKFAFSIASLALVFTVGFFAWNALSNNSTPDNNSILAAEDINVNTNDSAEIASDIVTVEMFLKPDSYPVGTKELTLTLKNNTSEELWYGMEYLIEQQVGDNWEVVPASSELAFIAIAQSLAANSEEEFIVNLSMLEPNLDAGNYRVVKTINNLTCYANFTLTE